jgi:hypothetical protein
LSTSRKFAKRTRNSIAFERSWGDPVKRRIYSGRPGIQVAAITGCDALWELFEGPQPSGFLEAELSGQVSEALKQNRAACV